MSYSLDIGTTNQEKIDWVEKYLSHEPEQKIDRDSIYRVSINQLNRGTTDLYYVEGYMLTDWLNELTDHTIEYLKDDTGNITGIEYCIGDTLRSSAIKKAPALYAIAVEYLASDELLDIQEVPKELIAHKDKLMVYSDAPSVIFDEEWFCFMRSDSSGTARVLSVEDVISETASTLESATEIYGKCQRIVESTKLSDSRRQELEQELDEAAEYIEECY